MNRKYALMTLLLISTASLALDADAGVFRSKDKQRAAIDAAESEALERLLDDHPSSKSLFDSAHGYAVFSVTKVSLGLTGGGGQGVAVDRSTGKRTYMRMGTGGLNFGAGGQVYQLVFLFEDASTFQNFVSTGWEAGASANAVAGRAGANAGATFINGVAVYQLTEAGLMLQVDVSGTKYWVSGLNE